MERTCACMQSASRRLQPSRHTWPGTGAGVRIGGAAGRLRIAGAPADERSGAGLTRLMVPPKRWAVGAVGICIGRLPLAAPVLATNGCIPAPGGVDAAVKPAVGGDAATAPSSPGSRT
jgi:hypothetical protein